VKSISRSLQILYQASSALNGLSRQPRNARYWRSFGSKSRTLFSGGQQSRNPVYPHGAVFQHLASLPKPLPSFRS